MLERRPQISVRCRPAPPLPDGLLHRAEAFLFLAVVIFGCLITRLFPSLDKGGKQRVLARSPANMKRAICAAPSLITAMTICVPRLHPFEIRQNIGITPAIRARLGPVIVIHRMAAHIDHAVDR